MKLFKVLILISVLFSLAACGPSSSSSEEAEVVDRQQAQYAIAQPVPAFDYSLERDLVIQLYNTRNIRAATHSVWRGDFSAVEGDCPSMGFGIPYDTSLTNPLTQERFVHDAAVGRDIGLAVVEQPEPNGIFASKNTNATWVMCVNEIGVIEPVYVESKVTVYPYTVTVDYETNRVTKAGNASVTINTSR